jgi:Protein phosphatase 2C
MSRWRVRARSVPKRGEAPSHNKDRVAIALPRRGRLLLAVADGATQAYRADAWAQLLVDAWTEQRLAVGRSNATLVAAIGNLSVAWHASAVPPGDAPWYVAAKASRGSFSTLLGVDVRLEGRVWRWTILAVGDTEFFVVGDGDVLIAAHPLARSSEFNNTPPLLATGLRNPDLARRRRIRRMGLLPAGGRLIAATDALAKCLLAAQEARAPIWAEAVGAARSDRSFARWIGQLREHGRLDDDDTTLLVAERVR